MEDYWFPGTGEQKVFTASSQVGLVRFVPSAGPLSVVLRGRCGGGLPVRRGLFVGVL
eukprot:COSAG02_NODE_11895_length_1633_cov_25.106910_2_plen_57_part_00